jgi:hypothetical protein
MTARRVRQIRAWSCEAMESAASLDVDEWLKHMSWSRSA